jgi:hypothetical protein
MRMGRESSTRRDSIFIDHAKTAKRHVTWIVILIKREGVIGV